MADLTVYVSTRPVTREKVSTLREASERVRAYIQKHALGASQWCGTGAGMVLADGKPIARVSYNGRVWSADGKDTEIPIE